MKGTGKSMLSLGRRPGESIEVSGPCTIHITEVRGNQVRLAIEADRSVTIDRTELAERKRAEGTTANGNVDTRKPCACAPLRCLLNEGGRIDDNHFCAYQRSKGERG